MKPVVLLQTPFFKAAGSHNNRVGLELCYASRYLEQAVFGIRGLSDKERSPGGRGKEVMRWE